MATNRRSPKVDTNRLNLELVRRNLVIPAPSLAEQNAIIEQDLRQEKNIFKLCQSASATSIDRLKEYRSALITAAVTGQIDVATYAKSGNPDRRLDAVQEEMSA